MEHRGYSTPACCLVLLLVTFLAITVSVGGFIMASVGGSSVASVACVKSVMAGCVEANVTRNIFPVISRSSSVPPWDTFILARSLLAAEVTAPWTWPASSSSMPTTVTSASTISHFSLAPTTYWSTIVPSSTSTTLSSSTAAASSHRVLTIYSTTHLTLSYNPVTASTTAAPPFLTSTPSITSTASSDTKTTTAQTATSSSSPPVSLCYNAAKNTMGLCNATSSAVSRDEEEDGFKAWQKGLIAVVMVGIAGIVAWDMLF